MSGVTAERLDELVDIDPLQLRDAAIALLADRDRLTAFIDRLRELMYMGGQNDEIVRRWALEAFAEFDGGVPS